MDVDENGAGRVARTSLVTQVADALLDQIVSGQIPIDGALPTESEIGETFDVSRVTVRGAIKTLQVQNVIRVQAGRGTFVNAVDEWSGLDSVLRATAYGTDQGRTSLQLVEVRRMIETGAAELAALRRTDADLEQLEARLERMRAAHADGDVGSYVEADIGFHDVILRATGNVFVGVLFEPLARVMREKREQTSAVVEIQAHAIEHHRLVLDAIRAGDAVGARSAMDDHMTQTTDDLRQLVLGV